MNVQDVLNSEDGALVTGLEGTISKSWPRTQAGNGYFQGFELVDDLGQSISIKAWDHDAHFEPGMRVKVSARQNDRKQWGGASRESYQGKVRVAVKKYAPVEILSGSGAPQGGGAGFPPSQYASEPPQASYGAPPRRPDPVFPGEQPAQQAFAAGVHPGLTGQMPANGARTPSASLTEAEARALVLRNASAFLEALGFDLLFTSWADIPAHILEVCASWGTHVAIGVQQGKIAADREEGQ